MSQIDNLGPKESQDLVEDNNKETTEVSISFNFKT